jgi:gamma-glutamyltranspeptidase/glutathione hydrolase
VRFDDGRTMVFGTMGGDGQPQTQAAVFSRYHYYGMDLQNAIAAPRWLLGRTWGAQSITLKIEENFAPGVRKALEEAGHAVEAVSASNAVMGHAGAVLRDSRGVLAGAADPRSDGSAAGF